MRIDHIKIFGTAIALLTLSGSILGHSQTGPAARKGGMSLEAGVGYSNFDVDYTSTRQEGVEAVADLTLGSRLGVEGEARWLNWHGSSSGVDHSASYLFGPRFTVVHLRRARGFAKLLVGDGSMSFLQPPGKGNFFAISPGGTLDVSLTRGLFARLDYEYQFWPNAPGSVAIPGHEHGLTPHGLSVGVVYRFWR